MKRVAVLSNILEKVPKYVDFIPKTEENSNNVKNINTMFFWDLIPSAIKEYERYCEQINTIYLTNHNFIKCEQHGRQEKEISK